MIPIELKKRYPHSREEDITDAFMRGYQACAAQGGDAEMDNCQVQAPQNYMQQSRHNDGTDLISRADAIELFEKYKPRMAVSVYEYGQALKALPSADAEWIPCSERLPIPPTFCLVTTDGSHGDVIDIALYMSDGWHKASEVLAWMPLPKPYKGGDDE